MLKRMALIFWVGLFHVACTSSSIFPSIGTHLGNPLTLAVNSAAARLYVNNSNNKDFYSEGSIQVYNIAAPAAPSLVGTQTTLSFSGQIYLDTVNQFLYTPNRYPTGTSTTVNNLLQVNINEASGSFRTVTQVAMDNNPFGIFPNPSDPYGRVFSPTLSGTLDSFAIGAGAPTLTSYNLTFTDSNGLTYTNPVLSELAIIGTQAFVPIVTGSIAVVNTTELGSASNAVDYVITGVTAPRGIATDGSYLYVANVDSNSVPSLLVLDPYSMRDTRTASTAQVIPITNSGVTVKQLTLGTGTSTTDPREVLVATNYVFVTNMGDDSITVIQCTATGGGATTISTCVSPGTTPPTAGTFAVNKSIAVGDQPFGMATLAPAGVDTHLYVANVQDNTISIIDLATLTVAATYAGP